MRKVGTSKAPKKLTAVRPKDFRIYEKILITGLEYIYSSGKGMNNTKLIVFFPENTGNIVHCKR